MTSIRHYSYKEGERTIGYMVGRPACKGATTIAKIEEERFPSGIYNITIFVMDKDNSATKWKTISVTSDNVHVTEYDWTKVIECSK